MTIRFYNTLTRRPEAFKPRVARKVNFFVCGPTVYDHAHIGHARTYVSFDAIVSYLRFRGYDVRYLMNITDIDDKIIVRAREAGEDPLALSRKFTKEFRADMAALKMSSAPTYAPASRFIKEIIAQVKRLIAKGFAYESRGSVYFSVKKFPAYGKLSHQRGQALKNAVRIEKDIAKRDPLDFVLWKAQKPGEPAWNSPWGKGRPGWHIEDTAISESYFGPQYDIHGGAIDLIFPHHESEIAQQEASSGKNPFVRLWLHTGLLNIGGQKMSKSLKNFITIREMLSRHSAGAFRLLVLRTHYRSPLQYSDELLDEAERALERLAETKRRLDNVSKKQGTGRYAVQLRKSFTAHLDNDFDTPGFIAILFDIMRAVNRNLDKENISDKEAKLLISALNEINSVLRIFTQSTSRAVPADVLELVKKRDEARKNKMWRESDEIRDKLMKWGWEVQDAPQGTQVRRRK